MEEGADEKLQREVEEQLKLAELERLMMQEEKESGDLQVFNSQAVGLDSWVQSALKSILRGDPIFESTARFFVIILKCILTSIFGIKIHEKNSPTASELISENFYFHQNFRFKFTY